MSDFYICENLEEATEYRPPWGNTCLTISREDIDALLAGKVLAGDAAGEYGLFIGMEEENDY